MFNNLPIIRLSFISAVLGLSLCLGIPMAAAEDDKKENVSEKKKEDIAPQLKLLQQQQHMIRSDYEEKKKRLNEQLQAELEKFQEESGKLTRQDIVKENNKKQEELRNKFQEEFRKLQVQERKLRLGRETLERPDITGGKQAEVYGEALTDKQKRLNLQKRREAQDRFLMEDRQDDENQPSSFKPPVFETPKSAQPATQKSPAKKFSY